MRRFLAFGPAFVVLVTAVVTLVVVPGAIRRVNSATTRASVTLAQQSLDRDDVLERLNAAVRNIGAAVEPSVVHLEVGASRRRMASGSGWIFDEAGHIVTNAHVVSGASNVDVQFHDGRVADAEVVGVDAASDIAVLRVEAGSHLVAARRGTGLRVELGDRVFAFGSPFGFKFSMSEGIVSGLGRSARAIVGNNGISNFIQTDAAVNPGNSGGPLVDIHGRVVGMNVAIATAQEVQGSVEGQSAGISFAIPLETIETRVEQIIEGGPIRTGFLGITFWDYPATRVAGFEGRGVAVRIVSQDGAAAGAGLRPGDVITRIDGQEIAEGAILRSLIASRRPGRSVALEVWRDGEKRLLDVVLGEMPPETLADIYGDVLLEQFGLGLAGSSEGPVVDIVENDSPASAAGFKDRQIIRAVAGRPVAGSDDVVRHLFEAGLFSGKSVPVTVVASGDTQSAAPRQLRFHMILPGR